MEQDANEAKIMLQNLNNLTEEIETSDVNIEVSILLGLLVTMGPRLDHIRFKFEKQRIIWIMLADRMVFLSIRVRRII